MSPTQSDVSPFARCKGERYNGERGTDGKRLLKPTESLLDYTPGNLSTCPNMKAILFQTESHAQTWEPRSCQNHRCAYCGQRWLAKEHKHLTAATEGLVLYRKELPASYDWKTFAKRLRARGARYIGFRLDDRIVVLSTVTTHRKNFLWDVVDNVADTIKSLLALHIGKRVMRSHEWAMTHSPVEFEAKEEPTFRKIRLYTHGGITGHRERCRESGVQTKIKRQVTFLDVLEDRTVIIDRTVNGDGKEFLYGIETPEYGTREWKEFSLALGAREARPVARRSDWTKSADTKVA